MLLDVVLEVGLRGLRTGHQHELDAGERRTHVGEELVHRAHRAAVLARVVLVRVNLGRFDMGVVEVEDLGVLVVEPEQGVGQCHGCSSSRSERARERRADAGNHTSPHRAAPVMTSRSDECATRRRIACANAGNSRVDQRRMRTQQALRAFRLRTHSSLMRTLFSPPRSSTFTLRDFVRPSACTTFTV